MPAKRIVSWVAEVEGKSADLQLLAGQLRSGDLLYVVKREFEREPPILHLGSRDLDGVQDYREVQERFERQIETAIGASAVLFGCDSIRFRRGLIGIRPDGSRDLFLAVQPGFLKINPGVVLFDGREQIGPTQLERWTKLSLADGYVADALCFLAGDAGWFDIYKAFEELEHGLNLEGGRRAISTRKWATRKEVDRFACTVQHYRHANKSLPKRPMTLPEAQKWLRQVLTLWIDSRQTTKGT